MTKTSYSRLLLISFLLLGCNAKYKSIKIAILNLPPKKLTPKSQQTSSGVTSKIDSLLDSEIKSKERLELILDLDNQLKNTFYSYKEHKSKENYNNVILNLNRLAIEKDITVKTKIKTVVPGATVKYRTQAADEEITANNLTNHCYVNFYIGNYYIWTERDDKKTSNPRKYFIAAPDSITLTEKRLK